jgi:hypothetical protein
MARQSLASRLPQRLREEAIGVNSPNIEHGTSNIQPRTTAAFAFDVGRSMFDVGRSASDAFGRRSEIWPYPLSPSTLGRGVVKLVMGRELFSCVGITSYNQSPADSNPLHTTP